MGYLFAMLSSLFFALYNVPKKWSKQKTTYYIMFMGISYFIVSLIVYIGNKILYPSTNETLIPNIALIYTALRGITWYIAMLLLLKSIDKIGFAKANQWKILQSPIGMFLILFFLQEFLVTKVVVVVLSTLLMTLSAFLITIDKGKVKDNFVKDKMGIIYAIVCAILLGLNAFVNKAVTNTGLVYAQPVYVSFFVMLSSIVYLLFKEKNIKVLSRFKEKDNYLALIGGVIYSAAAILSTLAYKYILGSIAFIIINLQSIWTLLIGIFIFKEINFKENWIRIILGIISAVIAIVLLLYA